MKLQPERRGREVEGNERHSSEIAKAESTIHQQLKATDEGDDEIGRSDGNRARTMVGILHPLLRNPSLRRQQ